jgi:glycosyltransferase involved in cell wall biosynthesis
MAEDLVENGLSVDVLCGYPSEYSKDKDLPKKQNYKNINIRRVKYIQLNKKKTLSRLINYFSFIFSMLLKWPRMMNYKCIIVYSNPPLLPIIPAILSAIFRKKFIFVSYDIYPDLAVLMDTIKKGSLIYKLMSFTNKVVYKHASVVIALGEEMKTYMLDNKFTTVEEKIMVIPNWYDGTKIQLVSSNIKMNPIEDNKFRVLYSGNMGTCQDMDTIMKCIYIMKDNRNIQFILTGHGNKVNQIEQYIDANNLSNVIMYGFLVGEEYLRMLESADCYLVSLERGVEGMSVPSKTYSYLAAGRPLLSIMSSDTDISKQLNTNNAGYSFTQGDAKGLANKIEFLSNNIGVCDYMGINARNIFDENYERKISTGKYFDVIRSLIT